MKPYKHKYTDLETEPDYPVTFKCIQCGCKDTVSGQEAEFYEVDSSNYMCSDCFTSLPNKFPETAKEVEDWENENI